MWMLGVLLFFGGLVGVIVYLARRKQRVWICLKRKSGRWPVYKILSIVLTLCLWLMCAAGCAGGNVKHTGALCQIRFDTTDEGLDKLNEQNVRAVLSFEMACGRRVRK